MKRMTSEELERGLQAGLKALRMPGMRMAFQDAADLARQESLSLEHFLFMLVETEQQSRTRNRVERALRTSHIPFGKTLKAFDQTRLPLKIQHQLHRLLEGGFLDRNENVLAVGPTGTGKTHLLCALGQELIFQGRKVIFYSSSTLVEALMRAKQDQELPKFTRQLMRYDALIVDGLGYVQHSREETQALFQLLAERYERGSVLISSHLPFSQWETIFHDPMTTAAAVDRLVHHCVVLELNLPSYRLESAQRRQAALQEDTKPVSL